MIEQCERMSVCIVIVKNQLNETKNRMFWRLNNLIEAINFEWFESYSKWGQIAKQIRARERKREINSKYANGGHRTNKKSNEK